MRCLIWDPDFIFIYLLNKWKIFLFLSFSWFIHKLSSRINRRYWRWQNGGDGDGDISNDKPWQHTWQSWTSWHHQKKSKWRRNRTLARPQERREVRNICFIDSLIDLSNFIWSLVLKKYLLPPVVLRSCKVPNNSQFYRSVPIKRRFKFFEYILPWDQLTHIGRN